MRLHVTLKPGCRRTDVRWSPAEGIIATVTPPPIEGKANAALLALLARRLDVAPSSIILLKGVNFPHKVLEIEGVSPAEMKNRLTPTEQ